MKHSISIPLTTILLVFMASCQTKGPKEIIDELLIFGYSGFCFKDSANRVYPSDEIWYNDSVRLFYDSTQLDIRQYFEFKKDSAIKVATRKPRKATEYFIIDHLDSIEFQKTINEILVGKSYSSDYGFNDTIPRIYDGWSYTLYYESSSSKDFIINYIPDCLPDSLKILHNLVESIIKGDHHLNKSAFRYDSITIKEAKRLFIKNPPPSLLDNTQKNVVYQDY